MLLSRRWLAFLESWVRGGSKVIERKEIPKMDGNSCGKMKSICKIVALVLVLAAVWFYLAHHEHMVWPGKCVGVSMKIENGEIRSAQVEGAVLAVTAVFPTQQVTKVIVYDYCQGRILSSVETSR
jgi:hypothetical protein